MSFGLALLSSETERGNGLRNVAGVMIRGKEEMGKSCGGTFVAIDGGETKQAESFGEVPLTGKKRFCA